MKSNELLLDAFGRIRHNEITFVDEIRDGVNETVARAHARIEFDTVSGAYLVFNESSTNPTFLVRHGRSLRINPRDPRGVRLETGDHLQIHLGQVEPNRLLEDVDPPTIVIGLASRAARSKPERRVR